MTLDEFLTLRTNETGKDHDLNRLSDTERQEFEQLYNKMNMRAGKPFLNTNGLSDQQRKQVKKLLNKVTVSSTIHWTS